MPHLARSAVILAAALVWPGSALRAENVFDSHFSAASKLSGCFVLERSPTDLAAIPESQVEFLSLSLSPMSSKDDRVLGLMVKLRDDPYYYYVAGHCRPKGDDQKCSTEGGFGFRVSVADSTAVRVAVLPKGLRLMGDRTVTINGRKGADREFVIPSVPVEMCN